MHTMKNLTAAALLNLRFRVAANMDQLTTATEKAHATAYMARIDAELLARGIVGDGIAV